MIRVHEIIQWGVCSPIISICSSYIFGPSLIVGPVLLSVFMASDSDAIFRKSIGSYTIIKHTYVVHTEQEGSGML